MAQGGLLKAGNVDLYAQPKVKNPDGTTSTVDSRSFNFDGREVLLPSVTPDGRHLKTDDEIVREYRKTGRHLGEFSDVASANAYASRLHDDYESGKYDKRMNDQTAEQAPRADQWIPIPGVPEGLLLPGSMSDAEIQAAATKFYQQQNPGKKQPPVTSWVDTAVDWLPQVGGAIGGIAGTVVEPGMGSVVGAGLGGVAGESAKKAINRMRGKDTTPLSVSAAADAASDVAASGVKQAAAEVFGGATGLLMKAGAAPLMRTALGNTAAVLSRKPDVAETALRVGATVTRSGIHKLDDLLATRAGLADRKALELTRKAVADAWKKTSLAHAKTLFGATAGNPAFQSAMAQGLYHAAGSIGHISPQVIRLGLGVADASDEP